MPCIVPRMNLNKITMGYMPVETCDLDFFQKRLETKVADLNNYSSYAPQRRYLLSKVSSEMKKFLLIAD